MSERWPGWTRAVVTGAGGFLGQHLVPFLREAGHHVVGIGRGGADTIDVAADLVLPGTLAPYLDGETAIFHLAGAADVRGSVIDPVSDFGENLVVSLNVLESARKARSPLVFPSTGSVYDPGGGLPFTEENALRPSSPYAAAKVAVEAYCWAYAQSYGLDVRVARLFSVFGPGMRRFAIHDFYHRMQRNPQEVMIRGDGLQTRDYLYVEDAVRGLYWVMKHGQAGHAYNVATGRPRSMFDVARAVAKAMGCDGCRIVADRIDYPAEVNRMEADVSKLAGLGFVPAVRFEEGLARTIAYFESRPARQ